MPPDLPQIAVIVATCDRVHMLIERSIPSILRQTHRPDHLLVIDDSSPNIQKLNKQFIDGLDVPGCAVTYMLNQRTPGAAGAWNTAIYNVLQQAHAPRDVYLAVLDDDDAWHPSYLERCLTAATEGELDMVAAGLRRIEANAPPMDGSGPSTLCADDFLIGNPGIQGSNLFLRLETMLLAGCFDEGLRSSTDRDLCIRIADLGTVRYQGLCETLVDHYADAGRQRLSSPGSASKIDGISAFWRKYAGRMSYLQRRAFCERASTLFGWTPPKEPSFLLHPPAAEKVALVLGAVATTRTVDLLTSRQEDQLIGVDVVLLEGDELQATPFADLIDRVRAAGLGCFPLTRAQQSTLSAAVEGPSPLLTACCAWVAQKQIGTQVWLVSPDAPEQTSTPALPLLAQLGATQCSQEHLDAAIALQPIRDWAITERIATAHYRVLTSAGPRSLRLLGRGSEAVVFTDGRTVYKCIDYWKTRIPQSQFDFLRSQIGRWSDIPGLYALRSIEEDGPWAIITYDYEPSTPYTGGYEDDLVALLEGCRHAGIVCNNIHPKNLVVAANGVKLIDYGSDIRRWTPLGFEHMVRRAYLSCHFASHPQLAALMRVALTTTKLPELAGYAVFRRRIQERIDLTPTRHAAPWVADASSTSPPFSLHVGVITADPSMVRPLLTGLALLRDAPSLSQLTVLVLENGSSTVLLDEAAGEARKLGLQVDIIDQQQQRIDAAAGVFGSVFASRPTGQVGIAQARSMLQRYLGARLASDPGSIGWVLDDDMRVDVRVRSYLPWLPLFRAQGTDVLLGAYEGSSPNPPLNGLRVQLVDLLHNLTWLKTLPPEQEFPNRSSENQRLRLAFPDYYYDLSRKHTAHLEMPHWLEPQVPGELVCEALSRLRERALGLLMGAPLTRPLVASLPVDPLHEARDSVNRGGCTFILNPRALTDTPNTITRVQGRETRRSDMLWAIVNRHYRGLRMKAVGFPIEHIGRVSDVPCLNLEKVCGEITGSALYAGLQEFLADQDEHMLDFTEAEIDEVQRLVAVHLTRRLLALRGSFYRIIGLRDSLRHVTIPGEFGELLTFLDRWFQPEVFEQIQASVRSQSDDEMHAFLNSLRPVADEFANAAAALEPPMLRSPQPCSLCHPAVRPSVTNAYSNWCTLPTPMGNFRMYDTGDEDVRVVCMGDINAQGDVPLLRVHSSCLASEVFGALDCDCADQLREAMKRIATEGKGMVIHLHQEGRGQGLSRKIHAVRLMESERLDTVEAFEALGLEQDIRDYTKAVKVLRHLQLDSVRLISNNPRKRRFLERSGIRVSSENTHPNVRPENEEYLHTKKEKLGHELPLGGDMDQGDIRFYHSDQPWGELSNFSRHAICCGEAIWPTVEHYYQAQKFAGTPHEEAIRRCSTPMAAKTLARSLTADFRRRDWDAVKEEVMLDGLRAKFRQHGDLRERLLSTGERQLIEHTADDRYWADGGDGSGANRLGVLLMQVRSELQR